MSKNYFRGFLSFVFFAGGVANLLVFSTNAAVYEGFADQAILPIYSTLWEKLIYPRLWLFLPAVILLELGISFGLLMSGKIVRTAFGAAALFMVFLIPFWWNGGAAGNIFLGGLCLWLARYEYDQSLLRFPKRGDPS